MRRSILGLLAIVFALTVSSFTVSSNTVKVNNDDTVWFYNGTGTSEEDFQNGDNWDEVNQGSCGAGSKPCSISAPATTQEELDNYLENLSEQDILSMSTGRKV